MGIRRNRPDLAGAYRTFGYPVTPLLFVAGNLWIVFHMIRSRPLNSLFGFVTIALRLLVYLWFARREEIRAAVRSRT